MAVTLNGHIVFVWIAVRYCQFGFLWFNKENKLTQYNVVCECCANDLTNVQLAFVIFIVWCVYNNTLAVIRVTHTIHLHGCEAI